MTVKPTVVPAEAVPPAGSAQPAPEPGAKPAQAAPGQGGSGGGQDVSASGSTPAK